MQNKKKKNSKKINLNEKDDAESTGTTMEEYVWLPEFLKK